MDHLGNVRAEIGARLSALDAANGQRDDQKLQWSQALSSLQDVDYAEAVSRMSQQLAGLQAAQQSYAKVAQLSLFNYL
jgi:flagellar hook-associated protein 3 FlgL